MEENSPCKDDPNQARVVSDQAGAASELLAVKYASFVTIMCVKLIIKMLTVL